MRVAQIFKLDKKAISFVLAFPHVDLDVPVHTELPADIDLSGQGKNSSKYLLNIKTIFICFEKQDLSTVVTS